MEKIDRTLRLPAVSEITGLPGSTIYERIAQGKFPKPVKLEGRAVGWIESEVAAWQAERNAERIARRDGRATGERRVRA